LNPDKEPFPRSSNAGSPLAGVPVAPWVSFEGHRFGASVLDDGAADEVGGLEEAGDPDGPVLGSRVTHADEASKTRASATAEADPRSIGRSFTLPARPGREPEP